MARGRVTICELVSANYDLQVAAQPSDAFTRYNFARVAEKLTTSLQCPSPASEALSKRALWPVLSFMRNRSCYPQESSGSGHRVPNPQTPSAHLSWADRLRCSPAGAVRPNRTCNESPRSPSRCRNRQLPTRTTSCCRSFTRLLMFMELHTTGSNSYKACWM